MKPFKSNSWWLPITACLSSIHLSCGSSLAFAWDTSKDSQVATQRQAMAFHLCLTLENPMGHHESAVTCHHSLPPSVWSTFFISQYEWGNSTLPFMLAAHSWFPLSLLLCRQFVLIKLSSRKANYGADKQTQWEKALDASIQRRGQIQSSVCYHCCHQRRTSVMSR